MQLIFSFVLIVFIHELSHFIIARLCGCKVEFFSIGLGRRLIGKQIGNTYYQISIIPFGGKCDLKGELNYSRDKDAFLNLTLTKKILITLAGIASNLITGTIALAIGSYFINFGLIIFGILSIILGITNLLPILPLDGSYIIYYPVILKKFGKKTGIKILETVMKLSLKVTLIINLLSLPIVIYYFIFLLK